jgi:hypothetical protein
MADDERHRELMREAIAREGEGHRALLDGDAERAAAAYRAAGERYRASWEAAPPTAFGRLIGLLKAAALAGGDASSEAAYVREQVGEPAEPSAAAAYALALAALVAGDDGGALRWTPAMRGVSEPFARAADAIDAIAAHDEPATRVALEAIVHDFEQRPEHLTGVPFADTAAMLDVLAQRRGMDVAPVSAVLAPRRGA